ncbi:MAG TPA: maleylpyruvate isomerase family mycothiol-dependent enzyme [Acidimicrobiia bacterium]
MVDDDQRHVERLEEVWSSTGRLGDSLTESQWKAPTECPGWDVQDNLAHIVGLESLLLGRPVPDVVAPDHAHVKNDMGRTNELWVEAFRGRPGAEVLDEFRSVTAERLAALRAPDMDFGADAMTPVGPGAVRDLLGFRVFDSWVHEQDMRRAVGKPGGWDGDAARASVARFAEVMPMVVGRKVKPADGTTVVFEVVGPAARDVALSMDGGRAQVLGDPPAEPTVRLRLSGETFVRLGAGRGDAEVILGSGAVEVSGDAALGFTIARAMNFMF